MDFMKRVLEVKEEESLNPERLHYLSFADEHFNGAVIIRARGMLDAVSKSHAMKINPGGQVLCVEIPEEMAIDTGWQNRLLTADDVRQIWPDAKRIADFET